MPVVEDDQHGSLGAWYTSQSCRIIPIWPATLMEAGCPANIRQSKWKKKTKAGETQKQEDADLVVAALSQGVPLDSH